jgi:uncharacterized protein with von Willebrand factor type A (vWA) domain
VSRDDLLDMLDLKGSAKPAGKGVGITAAGAAPGAPGAGPAATPNAVLVDEWGARRGRDLVAESDRLRAAGIDEVAAADFHAVAFDPSPELAPACTDKTRHEFLTQLFDTPEYRALHESTTLDYTASEIAATAFAEQYAVLRKSEEKPPPGKTGPGKTGGGKTGKPDPMAKEMAVLRAVGKALAEATEAVDEVKEAEAALGMGRGAAGGPMDPRKVGELYKRLRTDPALRRICELAGRFRRVAQSKQRVKATHGMDDLVGVEPGGELGRLLPVELAKLAVPELELDTLRRLVERQTLCREYQSVEPAGRGPIIVAIDESGSMAGEKVYTAKALALAMAWVARHQRRWVGLVAYSGDTGERVLALPPDGWDEAALIGWLTEFIGGGSDIDIPVREMPRMYADLKAPEGKTDVVFITDALCKIPRPTRERFNEWKAGAKARLITLLVGGHTDFAGLADISDEAHAVPELTATDAAVERVLSV